MKNVQIILFLVLAIIVVCTAQTNQTSKTMEKAAPASQTVSAPSGRLYPIVKWQDGKLLNGLEKSTAEWAASISLF